MGLSFHYKGRLTNAAQLPQLVAEVEDICGIIGWKVNVFESEYPEGKFVSPIDKNEYGILFSPPNCDPVSLVFDSEGRIYTPWMKEILIKHEAGEVKVITVKINLDDENPTPEFSEEMEDFDPLELVYSISVKSQFSNGFFSGLAVDSKSSGRCTGVTEPFRSKIVPRTTLSTTSSPRTTNKTFLLPVRQADRE